MIDLIDGDVRLRPWEDPWADHPRFAATRKLPGTIAIGFNDMFETLGAHATPGQARQLAAALVALADEIEGGAAVNGHDYRDTMPGSRC